MPAGEFSFDITPQDAIDYLSKRQKTELSWHWSDVQKQEHMRAFTVAKMTSATLLDDVRKSLDKAMAEGQSFQEWRKDIIPKLQGVWLGKTYGELWDGMTPAEQAGKTPPTPEERDRVIKASRLETIFRTNMFNAYAAGRYRQLKEDADIYPYWRYVTAKDSAVRPAHRALEGKVFKADDPFWSTHYPPNGFNCRCIVEAVDEYDLEMQDLKVQEGGNVYFDEESGQTVYRDAEGKEYPCDKGWDYNVGEDPTGKKTLASKKFPPELTKAIREDLKTEAERLKAEAKELEKARRQAEEESRRADEAQKVAEQAKKQAEAEAKRKAQEQRKAQAEAERKAKEQSQKAETEQKRFVVDVTRPSKPSKHPGKKATTDEQKRKAEKQRKIQTEADRKFKEQIQTPAEQVKKLAKAEAERKRLEALNQAFNNALKEEAKQTEAEKLDYVLKCCQQSQAKYLTTVGKAAILEYSGNAYSNMNALLRDKDKFMQENDQRTVIETKKLCDDAIEQLKKLGVPENIVLWRTANAYELLSLYDLNPDEIFASKDNVRLFVKTLRNYAVSKGFQFKYKAFTSTTASKGFEFKKSSKFLFTFVTGKNVKGTYIGPGTGLSKFPHEKEMLLAPNTKATILDVWYNETEDRIYINAYLGDF